MTEGIQYHPFSGAVRTMPYAPPATFGGHKTAVLSALLAAGIAALCACTLWAATVLVAAAVLALSIAENERFLLLTIFFLPVGWSLKSEGLLHDIPGAVHLIMFVGFFLGRFLRSNLGMRQLLRASPAWLSACFLGVAVASIMLTTHGWTYYSAHSLYRLASYISFFFLILAWANSRDRVQKISRVLFLSTIVTAVFAILQELVGGYTAFWLHLNPPDESFIQWDWRATSFLNYPNSLAGYLNLLLPFALACCILGQGKWKALGFWSCALGFVALSSTQSLGGLAAFIATLILAIFNFVKRRRNRLIFLFALCLFICLLYVSKDVLNPSHSVESVGPDASIRLVLWSTAWNFFAGAPLLGIGWGNFVGLYGSYTSSMSAWIPPNIFAVHNIYLQLLAETGLIGFSIFLWLMVKTWRLATWSARSSKDFLNRALAFGVQGAILSTLVHGSVDFLFQVSPQFGALFWVLLGLFVSSTRLLPARADVI